MTAPVRTGGLPAARHGAAPPADAAPGATPAARPLAAAAAAPTAPLPSMGRRLTRALLGNALLWMLAVSGAVWLAVRHEVFELMDDTLLATAQVMTLSLAHADLPLPWPAAAAAAASGGPSSHGRFAWQVVDYGADGHGRVVQGSPEAPPWPLRPTPSAGHGEADGWRVYGSALGRAGRMLYVAQSRDERVEIAVEVALHAALATLAVVLLAYAWLGARARRELAPLQRLSERLARHDLLAPQATLGPAERAELQPVHAAIDTLAAQLSRRLAHERLVAAHAAHALRTPLAGIDAQLAVALRESPPSLQPRLQRVREAGARLQRVVAALLALFRSGVELQRRPVELAPLLARLPVEGLQVDVAPGATLVADADLLSAALLNLLDNALRHGAHRVVVTVPSPQRLQVTDDGPGIDAARREALQSMLDRGEGGDGGIDGDGPVAGGPDRGAGPERDRAAAAGGGGESGALSGLGLRLADRVARAHGGRLRLFDGAPGFGVELTLGADADGRARSRVDLP